jgi:hypothetical protein
MSFDEFFRDLNAGKNSQKGKNLLCSCNEKDIKGKLINEGNQFIFVGNCSKEKACFKIHFDCSSRLVEQPEIISKIKRKPGVLRPTLDMFFGLSQKDSKSSDIPKPPPPHKDAKPNDF